MQKFTTSAAAINSRNVHPRVIRYIVIIALCHRLIFIPLSFLQRPFICG